MVIRHILSEKLKLLISIDTMLLVVLKLEAFNKKVDSIVAAEAEISGLLDSICTVNNM